MTSVGNIYYLHDTEFQMAHDEVSLFQLSPLRSRFLDSEKYFSSLKLHGARPSELVLVLSSWCSWVAKKIAGFLFRCDASGCITSPPPSLTWATLLAHRVACHRNPSNFYKCVWKKSNLSGNASVRVREETYESLPNQVRGSRHHQSGTAWHNQLLNLIVLQLKMGR